MSVFDGVTSPRGTTAEVGRQQQSLLLDAQVILNGSGGIL